MINMKLFYVFIILTMLSSFSAMKNLNAQKLDSLPIRKSMKLIEFAVMPVAYRGDLGNAYHQWNKAFSIGIRFKIKPKWHKSASIMWGNISGNDNNFIPSSESTAIVNKSFQTSFITAHLDINYHFFRRENFICYVGMGAGLIRFIVKDENGNNLNEQYNSRKRNEGYSNTVSSFPFRLGAIYSLNNGFSLGFQTGFLNPMTKYLDNIGELGGNKQDNILYTKFSVLLKI